MQKQRKYRWLSVLFSLCVPGLGLAAAGKIRRGIIWFIVLSILPGIALWVFFSSIAPYIAVISLILLILWLIMLVDSWKPVDHLSMKRCVVFIALAIFGLLYGVFEVSFSNVKTAMLSGKGSMSPTIGSSEKFLWRDRILWDDTAYRSSGPRRNDIVIVSSEALHWSEPTIFVKRVVALPHERVSITPQGLIINKAAAGDESLSQTNSSETVIYKIPETTTTNHTYFNGPNGEMVLGSNEYFILGDNVKRSYDSRHCGPVNASNILGKVEALTWPPNRIRKL